MKKSNLLNGAGSVSRPFGLKPLVIEGRRTVHITVQGRTVAVPINIRRKTEEEKSK